MSLSCKCPTKRIPVANTWCRSCKLRAGKTNRTASTSKSLSPNGVFAPYTAIPTNLLFFDRSGPTKEIWYYELPLPEGRKNYTKTKPLQFEEFADCIKWFQSKRRKESDHAWRVSAADVLKHDDAGALASCNLDIKNPNSAASLEHLPPEKLVEDILAKERRIIQIMEEIKAELAAGREP